MKTGIKIAAAVLFIGYFSGVSAFADTLNDYIDARPVVKKDLRIKIVLRYLTREIAKENGVRINTQEYKERTEEFASLAVLRIKNMCLEGTLEQETGLEVSNCKLIEQIQ